MTTENMASVPDVDAMSDTQFDELKGKMIAGEDVSTPVEKEPVAQAPVVDDDDFDDPASADAGQRQETIPFGRFNRANERRKEAETRATNIEGQNRILLERLEAVLKMVEPKPEPVVTAPPPDLKADPLGSLEYQNEQLRALQEKFDARNKQDEESAAESRLMGHAKEQFDSAAASDPTVRDAYTALFQSFAAEAKAFGLTGQALADHLTKTEKQHVFYALQNKIPLAEYARNMASARGWKPAPANAAPASTTVDPANALAQIAGIDQIKAASASLTPTGGAPARTGVASPQELLDMTPKQFDEWRSKNELTKAFAA